MDWEDMETPALLLELARNHKDLSEFYSELAAGRSGYANGWASRDAEYEIGMINAELVERGVFSE